MRSTFSGLNTVVRGLYANQVSLDTVGHNVTNAGTDGYSRQQVGLSASRPENIYGGAGILQVGTGVTIESVTRARDEFLDQRYWKENASLGYGTAINDYLGKVEGVFAEPTETGIQTVLDKFWQAIQTVGANPSDVGSRTALRQRGVELVDAVKQAETQLTDLVGDMNSVLDIKVDKINQITSEMLALNKQIVSVEVNGSTANDLRDRRDNLVDQLSALAKVSVYEDKAGNYIVQLPGVMLVNGERTTKLKTVADPADPTYTEYGLEVRKVMTDETPSLAVSITSGEIGGLLTARDSDVQGVHAYLDKLNDLARTLLTDFNQVHKEGYGLDNSTGVNFFGDGATSYTDANGAVVPASGTWLDQLQVNDALFDPLNGLDKIAAKTLAGNIAVTQSNTGGGTASVTDAVFAGGVDYVKFMVKINTLDVGTGAVTDAVVSLDGGANWLSGTVTGVANADGSGITFSLTNNATPATTATLTIKKDTDNKAGDTYTFQLPQGNGAGDNAVRLAQFLKVGIKDASVTAGSSVLSAKDASGNHVYGASLNDKSIESYYNAFIGALGVQKQNAQRLSDNQEALVTQVDAWRESVAGVNMDEELSNMIKFQKGYNASARVLTTMDEMLDKLINGTGAVGR